MTEAEAEAQNNDDDDCGDRADQILAELNSSMDKLRALNVQVAEFEKVTDQWSSGQHLLLIFMGIISKLHRNRIGGKYFPLG